MKRIFVAVLCVLALGACGAPEAPPAVTTAETTNRTATSPPQPKATWQEAYSEYILHSYDPEPGGYVTVGLADIDKNGVPELILIADTKGTLGSGVDIITYSGKRGQTEHLSRSAGSARWTMAQNGRDMYLFETFNRFHHNGYGFVTLLKSAGDELTGERILEATLARYHDFHDEQPDLYWDNDLDEEHLLLNKTVRPYLSVRQNLNGEWRNISGEEYLRLKKSYISSEEGTGDITDLPTARLDLFSFGTAERPNESYDWYDRPPTQAELLAFFAGWEV